MATRGWQCSGCRGGIRVKVRAPCWRMWAGAGAVSEASSGLSSWASVERRERDLPATGESHPAASGRTALCLGLAQGSGRLFVWQR